MADPGFPEGGAWTLQGGREHAKFSRKLHEIERIWTPRGACVPHAPPRSANVLYCNIWYLTKGRSRPLNFWVGGHQRGDRIIQLYQTFLKMHQISGRLTLQNFGYAPPRLSAKFWICPPSAFCKILPNNRLTSILWQILDQPLQIVIILLWISFLRSTM